MHRWLHSILVAVALLPAPSFAGSFVSGNTALPPTKTSPRTCSDPNPRKCIFGSDINDLWNASGDLRSHTSAWVHVASYGATGDGSDQTTKIQAAINSLASHNGGIVKFGLGDYGISGSGLVVPTGVRLEGAALPTPVGPGTVLHAVSASVTRLISFDGTDAGASNLLLMGEATKAVNGIDISTDGVVTAGRLVFRNVVVRSLKYGFHSQNGAFLLHFQDCIAWECKKGFFFDSSGSALARGVNIAKIDNCHTSSNTEHGLYAQSSNAVDISNSGFDSDATGIQYELSNGSIRNVTGDNSSTATFTSNGSTVVIENMITDTSQVPFSLNAVDGVQSRITLRNCVTASTVGTYSVTPEVGTRLRLDGNTFDKAIQNDGERFDHGYRTERGYGTITVSGTPGTIIQAITFSRAFKSGGLKGVTVVPTTDYSARINALVESVSETGFTVRFQRDDGGTWSNGNTQNYYWSATGADD